MKPKQAGRAERCQHDVVGGECQSCGAVVPSGPGSAEQFFNSEADFLRARIRRCEATIQRYEAALEIALDALDFFSRNGAMTTYAKQEAQRVILAKIGR